MTTQMKAELNPQSTLMFAEAGEGGAAVARFFARNAQTLKALGERLRASPPHAVVTLARGSSDHASTYGKYLIETLIGVPVASAALSVNSVYSSAMQGEGVLCIAVSQSGRSPDLLSAVEAYQTAGAHVVALVNDETSPLAERADTLLPLCAGPELSVAATKSYIASLAGFAGIAAHWSQDADLLSGIDALPQRLEAAFNADWTPALPKLQDARNLFIIGRGYGLALAQEAALKLKETCALHAEAFSSAEVKHGPMAIVEDGFPVIAFASSDTAGEGVRDVAAEFAGRGAMVLLADAGGQDTAGVTNLPVATFVPALEPIVMVQSFYKLANALSVARGLNPDTPPHLNKVTRTL